MGVRKNARFLSPTEREDFVQACVKMKAAIINPAAPANQWYSEWDQHVAIHRMIQQAFAPGVLGVVNFGHGGSGAFSFLSWHRYFLYRFELRLQSYVPGVMLPYWDWSDPASIMTDTFLGSDGDVQQGYFAFDKPGAGVNATVLPPWWPATLAGWRLPSMFGATWEGGLRRDLSPVAQLPSVDDFRETLAMSTYPAFQHALESGAGLSSFNQMHNGLHGWIGEHMSSTAVSPFDPIFYMHHCNIDRLWAMWQMDGHANEYPNSGGLPAHHRNDIMYPWTGGAAGYGTTAAISASIPMPDFSALGVQHNVDTLDFRAAYGYTYDTLAIVGIGLDRTGSMNGMTPDPMTTSAPDVTKWEAATRGVSAFLQDCETVQDSGVTYVLAGVKTFRRLGPANDFAPVFPAPGYGLVKNGTTFSKAAFDAAVAGMTPGGSTPLADALQDVQDTLVEPPFGGAPADEQRYLAMLTDGLLTAGSPMSSIPDGSFARTAVFAMGFGTGADVDYATLASMVAKGKTLGFGQVFHGDNAGTIDKFYSSALASAIGFTTVFDPVLEFFAGEHAHVDFHVTSAEDALFITAQGMDFNDAHWSFHLHGPDGLMAYGDATGAHAHSDGHGGPAPHVTVTRGGGRLSLVVQRNNAAAESWVGRWRLMAAYKARRLDAMLMPEIGEWLFPVSAGPVRGPRYARLLQRPEARKARRNVVRRALHALDVMPVGSNHNDQEACDLLVNIHARTALRFMLRAEGALLAAGAELKIVLDDGVLTGAAVTSRAFGRLIAPTTDVAAIVARLKPSDVPEGALMKGSRSLKWDPALVLAGLEKKDPKLTVVRDSQVELVSHHGGPFHVHEPETAIPGVYHLGVYFEGTWCPEMDSDGGGHAGGGHHHGMMHGPVTPADCCERFSRLLTLAVAVGKPPKTRPRPSKRQRSSTRPKAARRRPRKK